MCISDRYQRRVRGDGNIRYYEIVDEDPYAHFLTQFSSPQPQLGVAPFSKRQCDVKNCEIMKALKITSYQIQPLSFTVPRTRREFFQDDLFPNTVSGKPVVSSSEWFDGKDGSIEYISLKPTNMKLLSEAPKEERVVKVVNQQEEIKATSKEDVLQSYYATMLQKKGEGNTSDNVQGCDDDEWDD
eukprot:TRINITY_DN1776_c0_g1_i1.p2 TRINITY_DN1776_c0_g1~~TRINITY_DN1776_c0_g1_i1.p2  ORF type:complete len:193 (+),score=52.41 TRINITY_DN1776_c0_g1_i1:25-579(+)